MSQSLILVDTLSSPCCEKRKKKEEEEERETASKLFFPGRDMPCWLCHTGFSWLLGAFNGRFKNQSLNFMCM
jgi:hypothetical protein